MASNKSSPLLSIVIPAYNEAANFRSGVLQPALDYMRGQKYAWEVIFVDDGSTDVPHTLLPGLAKKASLFQVLKIPRGGKAAAVTAGMLAAGGDYVLFTDFDQSTPLYQVGKFLAAHRRGADVVIGHRTQTQNDTLIRRIRSWGFVILVQTVALPGITDTQCGFKSFTRPAAQKIFRSLIACRPVGTITGGYMGAFDVEALFLARKFGYTIVEVPVSWIKILSDRLNIWKEPIKMALDTLKVRLWDILGKYDQVHSG